MQTMQDGIQSLRFLVTLNWDRLLYVFTIAVALWLGAFVGTLI